MCDYSLEMYHSQPAREGVQYQTYRFPSNSIGLVEASAKETAICVQCGMTMLLDGVPANVRDELHVSAREDVVFTRVEGGAHHDGVRFGNGAEITLQRLGEGVSVVVTNDLSAPIEAPARVTEDA